MWDEIHFHPNLQRNGCQFSQMLITSQAVPSRIVVDAVLGYRLVFPYALALLYWPEDNQRLVPKILVNGPYESNEDR